MARRATVVVAGDVGDPPVVEPEVPWWGEARSLVAAAEEAVGAPLRLLRRLSVERGEDGVDPEVTYLFEREGGPPAEEPDHPLRSPWARSGWIDEVLAWEPVASRLAGRPVQEKWWNLSAVLEIPTATGSTWLKAIPPFFADEGRVIELLSRDFPVPSVLARGQRMSLLAPIPGEDQWEASDAAVEELMTLLVEIQLWSTGRLDEFLEAGGHDRRAARLTQDFAALLRRDDVRSTIDAKELDELDAVAPSVREWANELEACGLPVTLLHGDFHPGNARGVPGELVLLDWTDAAVGSPLLDLPPFLVRLPPERAAAARELVMRLWSRHVADVDFVRAFALGELMRGVTDALTFREFLDGIEPSERIDHETDVPAALRRVLEGARKLRI